MKSLDCILYDRDGANGLLHIQVCICHQPAHLPTKETVQYSCLSGSCTCTQPQEKHHQAQKLPTQCLNFIVRRSIQIGLLAYSMAQTAWWQTFYVCKNCSNSSFSEMISFKSFCKFRSVSTLAPHIHADSGLISFLPWALDNYIRLQQHLSIQPLTLNW